MQTLERVDQLSLIAASPMGKSIPDILDADKLQSVAIFLFRNSSGKTFAASSGCDLC
jgi:hypothetical protein